MTDKKLTDNEIIKALEYCSQQGFMSNCEKCSMPKGECRYDLMRYTYDLLNRLQEKDETRHKVFETKCEELQIAKSENERLEHQIETLCITLKLAKAEAYKEFAERLKEKLFEPVETWLTSDVVREGDIDNLLKELVGEQ